MHSVAEKRITSEITGSYSGIIFRIIIVRFLFNN